jgi:hypothetical protein
MHAFTELVGRGTGFILSALNETTTKTIEALQSSAATSLVKTLQMVQVQKTIMAVGMFSLFESMLQDSLQCKDGFAEAAKILDEDRAAVLQETFVDFQMAVNVLKHGRGRSYEALLKKVGNLPFKIKQPTQAFFDEGDVSEIRTLIEVDDSLILGCARVIEEVAVVIRRRRPGVWI